MLADEYDVEAWYLLPMKDYEQNPSIADEMTLEQIFKARHESCKFIQRISEYLRLYMEHVSFQSFLNPFFLKSSTNCCY